jgi:hypothetical protein
MASPHPDHRGDPDLPPGMDRDRVLGAYGRGVANVTHLAAKTIDWGVGTPAPAWTLLDLAGHVLSIARYFHRLLNAALAGEAMTGLPTGEALDRFNAVELSGVGELSGPERVLAFDAVARRYGERLAEVDWSLTLGVWEPRGPLTVAQHTLLAVGEWELHAWDVARSFGWDHRPDDPEVVAAGCRLLGDVLPAGDPWSAALRASGRRPRGS